MSASRNWGARVKVPIVDRALPAAQQKKPAAVLRAQGLSPGIWTLAICQHTDTRLISTGILRVNWRAATGNGGQFQGVFDLNPLGYRTLSIPGESIEIDAIVLCVAGAIPVPAEIEVDAWIAPGDRASPQPLEFSFAKRPIALAPGAPSDFLIPPYNAGSFVDVMIAPIGSSATVLFRDEAGVEIYTGTIAAGAGIGRFRVPPETSIVRIVNTGVANITSAELVYELDL